MPDPIVLRVVHRYAAQRDAEQFVKGFLRRHPTLRQYCPKRVMSKEYGGGGSHPEARQVGEEIHIYPKFWALNAATRDFVFAHELGHYVLSQRSLSDLIKELQDQGVDAWDASSLPFGQPNMDEAFADSFATFFLDRSELRTRYPVWDSVVQRFL
jgi:hypothetical protein